MLYVGCYRRKSSGSQSEIGWKCEFNYTFDTAVDQSIHDHIVVGLYHIAAEN